MDDNYDDIKLKDLIDAIEDCDYTLSKLEYLIEYGAYSEETLKKLNDAFNHFDKLERELCSARDNKILKR